MYLLDHHARGTNVLENGLYDYAVDGLIAERQAMPVAEQIGAAGMVDVRLDEIDGRVVGQDIHTIAQSSPADNEDTWPLANRMLQQVP